MISEGSLAVLEECGGHSTKGVRGSGIHRDRELDEPVMVTGRNINEPEDSSRAWDIRFLHPKRVMQDRCSAGVCCLREITWEEYTVMELGR